MDKKRPWSNILTYRGWIYTQQWRRSIQRDPLLNTPLAYSGISTVYTMHGVLEKPSAASLQPVGKISLPKPYLKEGIIVLEVPNKAAAPTVRQGAHVGINTLTSLSANGELFAVWLPYTGIVLRRVFWHQDSACFVLRAENPVYPENRIRADQTEWGLGRLDWVIQEL